MLGEGMGWVSTVRVIQCTVSDFADSMHCFSHKNNSGLEKIFFSVGGTSESIL